MANIFANLPDDLSAEQFSDLLKSENVRIERIVSKGQSSPESGWYQQKEHEWVMVLEGGATIQFADGREEQLNRGDYINIPAHSRHKVSRTDPVNITIWLAVFYQ